MTYQPEPKFKVGDHVYYQDFLCLIEKINWQEQSQERTYLIRSNSMGKNVSIAEGNEYFRKA